MHRVFVPDVIEVVVEEVVEIGLQLRVPTHEVGQSLHVVRNEERDVAEVGLTVAVGALRPAADRRVLRVAPRAVAVASPNHPRLGIEDVDVVPRPGHHPLIQPVVAHGPGHLCDAEVVVGEFERPDGRLAVFVRGDVSEPDEVEDSHAGDIPSRALRGGVLHHGLERLVAVVVAQPLDVGVGNHRVGMGPVHDVRIARAGPFRDPAALVVGVEQRLDHPVDPRGLQKDQQRVQRAEGVPQREVGVHHSGHDLPVECTVMVSSFGDLPRQEHAALQGGVEDLPVSLGGLDADLSEGLLPGRSGLCAELLEGHLPDLLAEIPARLLEVDERRADLHLHGLAFRGCERHVHRGSGGALERHPAEPRGVILLRFHAAQFQRRGVRVLVILDDDLVLLAFTHLARADIRLRPVVGPCVDDLPPVDEHPGSVVAGQVKGMLPGGAGLHRAAVPYRESVGLYPLCRGAVPLEIDLRVDPRRFGTPLERHVVEELALEASVEELLHGGFARRRDDRALSEGLVEARHEVAGELPADIPLIPDTPGHGGEPFDLVAFGKDAEVAALVAAGIVDEDVRLLRGGIGELQVPGLRGSGQLRADAVILEGYGVVVGLCDLAVVRIPRSPFGDVGLQLADRGHDREGPVFRHRRTIGVVRGAEPLNPIVLPGVGDVALGGLCRPLGHGKGQAYPRIDEAVRALGVAQRGFFLPQVGADPRVDILEETARRGAVIVALGLCSGALKEDCRRKEGAGSCKKVHFVVLLVEGFAPPNAGSHTKILKNCSSRDSD